MNFLEELAAEWYSYKGYLIHTNIIFGPGKKSNNAKGGGFVGEIDVAAYEPNTGELIHIETSTDTDSWQKREAHMKKKFKNATRFYHEIFAFHDKEIRKIAILSFADKPREQHDFGDIEIITIEKFIKTIIQELKSIDFMHHAIPENYPLMRAMQFAIYYNQKSN